MSEKQHSPAAAGDLGVPMMFQGLALGILAGILAALIANAFVAGVGWLNDSLLISPRSRMMQTDPRLLTLATILVPTLGGLLVGFIHGRIEGGKPHSVAQVIQAVQTRSGHLPARPACLSGLSALVSLGSGASVGQYGPLVHLGGSTGAALAKGWRTDVDRVGIAIACGVAAAIASVFNAPIAGILFAHEVLLRHFALRAFAPIALAAIAGHVVANAILPQPPLFQIEAAEVRTLWEFGLFPLLGVASALVAVGYMHSILAMGRWAARLPLSPGLRPAVAGAVLGLVALWVPEILGMGGETLRFAFIEEAFTPWELVVILGLKILATAWCLGMGFAGGIFSPALVVGSLFGALFGTGVGLLFQGAGSELVVYAVCGMVAVTAPVIGAPLTTVVMVFELTGNYPLTIAALATVALANLLASRLFGRSLFDRQLAMRGLDLSGGRARALLEQRTLGPLMSRPPLVLEAEDSVAQARSALGTAGVAEAYLVAADGQYRGRVRLQDLMHALDHQKAEERIVRADKAVSPQTSLWTAMALMRDFVGEGIAVVDEDGHLVGTLFESDLIRAYLAIVDELRREEHALG